MGPNASPRPYWRIDAAEWADQLERILAGPPAVLLRGATVLSMDPDVGDLPAGDVLIRSETIEAVGADLAARAPSGTVVVDLAGMVLIPGLVDGHRHCWQNAFRKLIVDANLSEYIATTHGGMALHYRPEDMYIGDLATMLGALDGGVTTVLDLSHNSRSRRHSDAVLSAYETAGIRAVHAGAPPNAGEWEEQFPHDLLRLRDDVAPGNDGRTTVRMAIDMRRIRPVAELVGFAREHGFAITFDGVMGPGSSDEVAAWGKAGLLGPDVTIVHCTDMHDDTWQLIADSGAGVTLAPTSDEQIGLADALPPIDKALRFGVEPSLSVDVEVSLASDMYTQMRTILCTQRMMATYRAYHEGGLEPVLVTNRDVLRYATVQGARDVGLGDVCGRLAPGLAADVVAIRAEDVNNMPLNNAVGTVVQGTDARNVDCVFVGGRPRKWRGELVGIDVGQVRDALHDSRDRLAAASGWDIDVTRGGGNVHNPFSELVGYLDERQHL
jgi:cytosine/adenosine deaminase-related metal-dependent hydrolase